jgi:flagellar motor switch protein FliN/FliY
MPDDLKPDSLEGDLTPGAGGAESQQSGDSAGESNAGESNAVGVAEEAALQADFKPVVNANDVSQEDAEAAMLAMLEKESQMASADAPNDDRSQFPDLSGIKMERPVANPVEFQQLSPQSGGEEYNSNIDLLLDVKMPVAIELGRTEMPISEILGLGPGSVVELNKLAGEPVDLLVNNKIIARGEVVVVDENFGVRITLLMSPSERLKSLAQE